MAIKVKDLKKILAGLDDESIICDQTNRYDYKEKEEIIPEFNSIITVQEQLAHYTDVENGTMEFGNIISFNTGIVRI